MRQVWTERKSGLEREKEQRELVGEVKIFWGKNLCGREKREKKRKRKGKGKRKRMSGGEKLESKKNKRKIFG